MHELNNTQDVSVIEQDDFDTLTAINQGDAFSLAQLDEDGDLHSIIIGSDQAAALMPLLQKFLG